MKARDDAVKAQGAGPSSSQEGPASGVRRMEKRFSIEPFSMHPRRGAGFLLRRGARFHHSQARLWFGSATPNDHALRVSQMTALRPLRDQTVPGGPLEWDAAPFPRLAALMKQPMNQIMRVSRGPVSAQFPDRVRAETVPCPGKFPACAKPLRNPKVCLC